MPIVGGLDIHRKQITFDYVDTVTGQVQRGQVSPASGAEPARPGNVMRRCSASRKPTVSVSVAERGPSMSTSRSSRC
jgi:hypothetical protein